MGSSPSSPGTGPRRSWPATRHYGDSGPAATGGAPPIRSTSSPRWWLARRPRAGARAAGRGAGARRAARRAGGHRRPAVPAGAHAHPRRDAGGGACRVRARHRAGAAGGRPDKIAAGYQGLGNAARLRGDAAQARRLYETALTGYTSERFIAVATRGPVLIGLAWLAIDEDDTERPASFSHDALDGSFDHPLFLYQTSAATALAGVAAAEGTGNARHCCSASRRHCAASRSPTTRMPSGWRRTPAACSARKPTSGPSPRAPHSPRPGTRPADRPLER